jgi:type IV secretory pathway VirB2 component (pilin)
MTFLTIGLLVFLAFRWPKAVLGGVFALACIAAVGFAWRFLQLGDFNVAGKLLLDAVLLFGAALAVHVLRQEMHGR